MPLALRWHFRIWSLHVGFGFGLGGNTYRLLILCHSRRGYRWLYGIRLLLPMNSLRLGTVSRDHPCSKKGFLMLMRGRGGGRWGFAWFRRTSCELVMSWLLGNWKVSDVLCYECTRWVEIFMYYLWKWADTTCLVVRRDLCVVGLQFPRMDFWSRSWLIARIPKD